MENLFKEFEDVFNEESGAVVEVFHDGGSILDKQVWNVLRIEFGDGSYHGDALIAGRPVRSLDVRV
jgi:hypothetical protein